MHITADRSNERQFISDPKQCLNIRMTTEINVASLL